MTVHFLYPYCDDGHDGRELRYSLRGLDTFFHRPFDVTIVGDPLPSWTTGVNYVPDLRPGGKQLNILLAVLKGCRVLTDLHPDIDEVVCMDDDYMLLESVQSILPYYSGTFEAVWKNRNRFWEADFDWWLTSLVRTYELLRPIDQPLWYDLHRPFLIDPRQAIPLLSNFENKPPDAAPMWRTLYGNFATYDRPVSMMHDVQVWSSWPKNTSWVSTDQRKWDKAKVRLAALLPDPSRFES